MWLASRYRSLQLCRGQDVGTMLVSVDVISLSVQEYSVLYHVWVPRSTRIAYHVVFRR